MMKNKGHWFYDEMNETQKAIYLGKHPNSKMDRLLGNERVILNFDTEREDVIDALQSEGVKEIDFTASFFNLIEFLSLKMKKPKESFDFGNIVKSVEEVFECSAMKPENEKMINKGVNGTIQLHVVLHKDTLTPFNQLKKSFDKMMAGGVINDEITEDLKLKCLRISKVEGYEKKGLFAIYLLSELQKGVKCKKQTMSLLADLTKER